MLPQAAIEVPRFATYSYPGSFEPHAYQPDELRIERRLAEEVGDTLAGKGHKIVPWPDWTWKAGGVCAITIDHARWRWRLELTRVVRATPLAGKPVREMREHAAWR